MKNYLYLVLMAFLTIHGLAIADQTQKEEKNLMSLPRFKDMTKNFTPSARFKAAAMIHIYMRRYEQAIPLLEALVKKTPTDAASWMLLAIAYNCNDEPLDAFETANIALTLRPSYTSFLIERGIAAFNLGRDQEAARDLSRFLQSYSNNAKGHYYLGLVETRLGNTSKATSHFLTARKLNPRLSLMADYFLGLIAAQEGRTPEAKFFLKKSLEAFRGGETLFRKEVRQCLQALDSNPKAESKTFPTRPAKERENSSGDPESQGLPSGHKTIQSFGGNRPPPPDWGKRLLADPVKDHE